MIEKHCISDLSRDVTVFWKDTFLEEQTPENLPFYKIFVTTQMFLTYTDRYLRDYDKKRRGDPTKTPSKRKPVQRTVLDPTKLDIKPESRVSESAPGSTGET